MFNHPSVMVVDDFSDDSKNALIFANDLRLKTSGDLTVVFFSYQKEASHDDQFMHMIDSRLFELNMTANTQVLDKDDEFSLLKLINQSRIDLLILSEPFIHPFLSSQSVFATKLVNKISIPLLIFRNRPQFDRVDVLLDPRFSMNKILSLGEEISNLLSAKLGVVTIWDQLPRDDYAGARMGYPYISTDLRDDQKVIFLKKLKSIIQYRITNLLDPDIHIELPIGKKRSNQLLDIIHHDQADLIILQKHQRSFLESLFFISPIKQLIKKFEGSILVCPS
jgi:nucleotide-binding universal stress UspA family protein